MASESLSKQHSPAPLIVNYEAMPTTDGAYRYHVLTLTDQEGRRIGLIPVLPDIDTVDYQPETGHTPASGKAANLAAAGVAIDLLPAHGRAYTPAETVFAKQYMGLSAARLLHPNLVTLKPASHASQEVYFFEPTPTTLLDVMALAGHSSPQLRELRRAAAHHEGRDEVRALEVMCTMARSRDEHSIYPRRTQSPADGALIQVFAPGYMSVNDLVERLCKRGLEASAFTQVYNAIRHGLNPEAISTIAVGGAESQRLVQDCWRRTIAMAEQENDDRRGIYVEVHRLGNQLLYIPATENVSWSRRSPGLLGFVAEDSNHTLADIYAALYASSIYEGPEDPDKAKILDVIGRAPVVELCAALGLGQNTAVARGRWKRDQTLTLQASDRGSNLAHNQLAIMLLQLRDAGFDVTLTDAKKQKLMPPDLATGAAVLQASYIDPASLGIRAENVASLYIAGIATATEVTGAEDVMHITVSGAETNTKLHDVLYRAFDLDPQGYLNLAWGSKQIPVAMRYGIDSTNEENQAQIMFGIGTDAADPRLEQALASSIAQQLHDRNGYQTTITVAYSNKPPKVYLYKPEQ